MLLLAVVGISLTIFFETVQQLAFKQASRVQQRGYVWTIVASALYIPQLLAWFFTLTLMPLSIGAPLLGASYVTVPLASKFLFKENVSRRRWLGILLIVVGMVLISKNMES